MGFQCQRLILIFTLTLPYLMGYIGSFEWLELKKMHESAIRLAARENTVVEYPKYLLQFDGGSRGNPGSGGSGAVIYENQKEIWNGYFYLGPQGITNNVAEYWGLVHGLRQCSELGLKNITIEGDSELILRQIQGIYQVKNEVLKELYFRAIDLMKSIPGVITIQHIPREQNKRADFLSNMAMDMKTSLSNLSPAFILSQRLANKAGQAKGFSRPPKSPPTTKIPSPNSNTTLPITQPLLTTLTTETGSILVSEPKQVGFSHIIHIIPLIEWPKPSRPTQVTTPTEHISVLLAESKRLLNFISIYFDDSNMKRLISPTDSHNSNNNRTVIIKASDDFLTDFLRKSRIKGTIIKTDDFLQTATAITAAATAADSSSGSGSSSCTYFIKILGTSQLSTKLNKAMIKLYSRIPATTVDISATTAVASDSTRKKRAYNKKKSLTKIKIQDIPRSLGTLDVDNIQLFDLHSLLPELKKIAMTGIQIDRLLYGWALGQQQSMMALLMSGGGESSGSSAAGGVVSIQKKKKK